jgi:hypothetical protein
VIEEATLERLRCTAPRALCAALGLEKGARRQARGWLVRCPAHEDRSPSCSVICSDKGRTRVHCFGCGLSGDCFVLAAPVLGRDLRREFPELVRELGERLGETSDLPALRRHSASTPARAGVWDATCPVTSDVEASGLLTRRGIDPSRVAKHDLARVVATTAPLPSWAQYGNRSWTQAGYRLVLQVFDFRGACRSLRAWHLGDGADAPKRIPPRGCRASSLVLANSLAIEMLLGTTSPKRLLVVEGEPDFLTAATTYDLPALGVLSGSWHGGFANAIPSATQVLVATHTDAAGDRYARTIHESLGERVELWRLP